MIIIRYYFLDKNFKKSCVLILALIFLLVLSGYFTFSVCDKYFLALRNYRIFNNQLLKCRHENHQLQKKILLLSCVAKKNKSGREVFSQKLLSRFNLHPVKFSKIRQTFQVQMLGNFSNFNRLLTVATKHSVWIKNFLVMPEDQEGAEIFMTVEQQCAQ